MRRPLAVVLTLPALVLGACSGDDDAGVSTTTIGTTTTTEFVAPDVPIDPSRCEDTPDPADYVDVEIPIAIRPCTVPTELVVQTIREGSGIAAESGDGVIFQYTAIRSADGGFVLSSWDDPDPISLPAIDRGNEIPGVDQNLVGVQGGEILRLDIPADLAYGDEPPPELDIAAGEALTFVIDVLAVVPSLSEGDLPGGIEVAPSLDATELRIDDLVEGDGKVIEVGDDVIAGLILARGDNEVILYSSWSKGSALSIPIDPARSVGPEPASLPGIVEGLQGARVGGVRAIAMPPESAWGPGGLPLLGLPPDTDLIAIVQVFGAY